MTSLNYRFFPQFKSFLYTADYKIRSFFPTIYVLKKHNSGNLHFSRFKNSERCFCFKSGSKDVKIERDIYLNMSLEEKRKHYRCGSKFVTLEQIPTWNVYAAKLRPSSASKGFSKNAELNKKVSIFQGDITSLEIDAIVNAANKTLLGGGGVDGCIHRAAGPKLVNECATLNGCPTGNAKITGGYQLPAKYVIHTVGPVGEKPDLLKSCYESTLSIAKESSIRSIAFPCISTGIYHYPNEAAARVALQTVRNFLENNPKSFDRIIFCLFLPVDVAAYELIMPDYFPL